MLYFGSRLESSYFPPHNCHHHPGGCLLWIHFAVRTWESAASHVPPQNCYPIRLDHFFIHFATATQSNLASWILSCIFLFSTTQLPSLPVSMLVLDSFRCLWTWEFTASYFPPHNCHSIRLDLFLSISPYVGIYREFQNAANLIKSTRNNIPPLRR